MEYWKAGIMGLKMESIFFERDNFLQPHYSNIPFLLERKITPENQN